MALSPGMRVVRGAGWKWGEQDGGEGRVGTVAEVETLKHEFGSEQQYVVVVQWDLGKRCNYRVAVDDQYDLLLLDNDPIGSRHDGIMCDECRVTNITGMRWKCLKCLNTNLCSICYHEAKHFLDHKFTRIISSHDVSVEVPSRQGAKRIMSRGLFKGAEVVRGHDWLWEDQDGGLGMSGEIHQIRGLEHETSRSVAEVEWAKTGKFNVYRVGHKGKVDLKCIKAAEGGYYYPSHLPSLGEPLNRCLTTTSTVHDDVSSHHFPPLHPIAPGDNVRIELNIEVFKIMQEGHGGWDAQIINSLSDVGTVQAVLDNGDVRVKYPGARVCTLNWKAVTKVTHFSARDIVRVINDIAAVHNLQENHGGWVDDMALSLGQVGRVMKVFPTGDLRVTVNSRTWTFNPSCLTHAPLEEVTDDGNESIEEEENLEAHLKFLSVLDNPAIIVAAAASADIGTLRNFLSRNPTQVNTKAGGKAAIHCACAQGNVNVLKCLLEYNPDVEIADEDGDRPIHLSAYSDEDEVAQLLIGANADVNSKNNKGATPLIIAAVKGHHSVLRVLTCNPNIRLHEQDLDGDTALHCAVLAQKNESVNILLEAGADPTLVNFRLFTPIHEAARIGFLSAIDHFIRRFPTELNILKDDGFTPLHLAAFNNHIDVVTSLAEHEMCNIDALTNEKVTALHLAIQHGHLSVVERLIGYGADLNIQDNSGDIPLHNALNSIRSEVQYDNIPQMRKIKEELKSVIEDISPGVVVACFLVQEGADIHVRNLNGTTPLQLAPPNVSNVIRSYKERKSSFHGSMKFHVEERNLPKVDEKATAVKPQGDELVCFLCEAPVDVRFEPCGHSVMCSSCAERAKKCPICKNQVTAVCKLRPLCVFCKEDVGSVTVKPCGHIYCQACGKRIKTCFECRRPIESKEGLELDTSVTTNASPAASSATSATSSSSETHPVCAICLTEPRNTALQCGHLLCWDCAQRVDNCPVCRKFVSHRIRIFQ